TAYVPVSIRRVTVVDANAPAVWGHAVAAADDVGPGGDVTLYDAANHVVVQVQGLRLHAVAQQALAPPRAIHVDRDTLTTALREIIASLLGLPSADQVPANTGFFELGLTSLGLLELRNRSQQLVGGACELTAAHLFSHPTPEALADFLAR